MRRKILNYHSKSIINGFTLIELLAVIVILAIIALIAVPLIINVIDKVKRGAFEDSAYGIISAAELYYTNQILDGNEISIKTFSYPDDGELKYKGKKPKEGTVSINSQGQVSIAIQDGTYCISKDYSEAKVTVTKDIDECDLPMHYKYDEVKGVNKPQLVSGMTPVKWDGSNWVETNENDPEWYDYKTKKWANVRTADGSFWVWIPRYAYKITSGYHSSTTGTIDIKFLKGKNNMAPDETKIESKGYDINEKNTSTNYFLHPAFTNNNKLGYWIAKFEPTAVEGVESDASFCQGVDNVSTKIIKVVPNATIWRCINIKNAYTASLNMKNKAVYGWNSISIDTHMMTNLEWGAVAYLSKSIYGANTEEVWNNAYNQYKTGCGGSSVNVGGESTCYEYHTPQGVKASTTHNIYGVYDMSGGAWEMTMSVYNNLHASSGFSAAELAAIPAKHINKYATANDKLLNGVGMDYDTRFYGDAIYETNNNAYRYDGSTWIGSGVGSWYWDYSFLTYQDQPWINRGGGCYDSDSSGLFAVGNASGGIGTHLSFRPIVSVIE